MPGNKFKKERWLRVTIPATRYYEDIVASFLVELTGSGVEFAGEGVTAYLPCDSEISLKIKELNAFLRKLMRDNTGQQSLKWFGKIVYEEDWSESWKAYFRPVRIGKKIVISPSWEKYVPENDEIVIRIDPGQAFGVGTHPTTRMCVKWIEKFAANREKEKVSGWTLCDVGCGTGILSIVGSKLGAKMVLAVDVDPVAVEVTRNNCIKNRVEGRIRVVSGSIDNVEQKFSCVAANLTGKLLRELVLDFKKVLLPGGWLIISGMLDSEMEDIEAMYGKQGYYPVGRDRENEWGLLAYTLNDH